MHPLDQIVLGQIVRLKLLGVVKLVASTLSNPFGIHKKFSAFLSSPVLTLFCTYKLQNNYMLF